MIRSGSCNLCGQCCGADGRRFPFSKDWPECFYGWLPDTLRDSNPLVAICKGLDKLTDPAGLIRVAGVKIYWIWVDGVGLRKDLPPYGSDSAYMDECPFLLPDPGDNTRPCMLYGRVILIDGQSVNIYESMCADSPQLNKTADDAALWASLYPGCSYTYSEE